MWTQIRGKNPQTGEDIDEWNCSMSMLPMLLMENAKQARSGAAATESLRNEIVMRVGPPRMQAIDPTKILLPGMSS
jgi:hypothetical protein